ncbi:integrase core domain-containing protein [Corallococcus sp. CA047B]|uniref:integrase core domain-containing protein n=1 Tax=Corallococcus sp. CA047B TaxID=2316729 RepID=UPI0013152E10
MRPRVSDDNAFSEALFRTLKYCRSFPQRAFTSPQDAKAWTARFVTWHNTEHRHSAIRFVTPEDRHLGREAALLAQRHQVYQRARARPPSAGAATPATGRQWAQCASSPHRKCRS